jgi:hypothetical protein
MVVVLGIFPQIVAGQLAGRPGLVKRMAKQVVFMNAVVESRKKRTSLHREPPETFLLYEAPIPMTR